MQFAAVIKVKVKGKKWRPHIHNSLHIFKIKNYAIKLCNVSINAMTRSVCLIKGNKAAKQLTQTVSIYSTYLSQNTTNIKY